MTEKKRAPLLIDEPTILVYPSLAVALGINKAIVFQQLHFLMNGQKESKNKNNLVEGRWWVYNSYQEWQRDYFPWLSASTIKGIFLELEEEGLITARQMAKHKSDRRKWYSIDYAVWDKKCLVIGQKMSHQPSDNNCPMDETENIPSTGQKIADGLTETSLEVSSDVVESAPPAAAAPLTVIKENGNATNGATQTPPTPIAAAPLPQSYRAMEAATNRVGYPPLIEAWRAGYPSKSLPTPKPGDIQLAIETAQDGYTADQVTALTKEKLATGKTNIRFRWVVEDLADYVLRQAKSAKTMLSIYVPEPVNPAISQDEIDAIKAKTAAKLAAQEKSA